MESVGIVSFVANAFSQGGFWMWVILAVQVVSVAIIVERAIFLYFFRKGGQKELSQKLEKDIKQGQLESAMNNARSLGSWQPISQVVLSGTQAALDLGGREEIEARMEEVLVDEKAQLEKRTGFLAMIGNVATLIGLLGTIVGLIQAFASVSGMNPVEKAAALTGGVSMAMYTTAYGLIVAIPALVMYSLLQNRSNLLIEDLSQGALRIYNCLSFRYEAISVSSKKKTVNSYSKSKAANA